MESFLYGLSFAIGLVNLACFIFVIYNMFQYEETMIAVACLIGIFCAIGPILAFIYGWIRSGDWEIRPMMVVWSAAILINVGVAVLRAVLAGA